jgi:plasmid stabilization system protein ParE
MSGRRRRSPPKAPHEIVWTERALSDLRSIDEYIAADDPRAATRWIGKIIAAVELAASAPLAGRIVPEKRQSHIREVLLRTYRIVYRVCPSRIEVLTVFEGHRRFPGDVA